MWVCRDADALGQLIADTALDGLPAVMLPDIEKLRALDDVALCRVLDWLAISPGSRIEAVIRPGPTQ
jgi:hypothetical protein